MAASISYSHSPQPSHNSLRRAYALDPVTPIHSPHHSIHSSTSSRTPVHTLSIHEYRKQQNTPTPQSGTPSGKSLRRKPAASALGEVERVSSISRTPVSATRAPPRPLHISQSAHQLTAHQTLPPSPPHFDNQRGISDLSFRSQSTNPIDSGGASRGYQSSRDLGSVSFRSESTGKVSNFKSIKRLPKPQPFATSYAQNFPPPLASVTLARSRLSPLQTISYSDQEAQLSSDAQTTPTPSTLSISRFPQPPHVVNPSLSPPNDENAPQSSCLSNYTTTAPATPPTTPAIIHYRGTSFDLVNPHDSLLFHDIVTPSRDLDSTDYLLSPSSEDPLVDSDMMAPKRSLYGDLNTAYSSIAARRAAEDSPASFLNLPLPPTPAAFTPGSSAYSSPTFSFESNLAVSPLALRKEPENESRFSLAQLTRSLTKKLVKTPELAPHELKHIAAHTATPHLEGQYPRPLDETYRMAPITYDHPAFHSPNSHLSSPEDSDFSIEQPRHFSQRIESAPLASMVPDDPSIQIGRGASYQRTSVSDGNLLSRPYYEDMASIYPGSSIYSHEGDDSTRGYPPSLYSKRKSNPFAPLNVAASDYNRDSLYDYAPSNRDSRHSSRPLTQNYFRFSKPEGNEKTDTISKFIDHYGQVGATNSLPIINTGESKELAPAERPALVRGVSGFSQFDFALHDNSDVNQNRVSTIPSFQPERGRKAMITQVAGSPPRTRPPPLDSAFEYDENTKPLPRLETSNLFSGASSYGDTRNLLLITPHKDKSSGVLVPPVSRPMLEPSSSYSQQSGQASPHTPQEALDQAERIFGEAAADNQDAAIPAMWARRGSGNLLRSNRQSTTTGSADVNCAEEEKGDWETVGSGNRVVRYSVGDSIADYSSSDESRNSLRFTEGGSLPVIDQRDSSFYRHPSPLPPHRHPFSSSPPNLNARTGVHTAPDKGSSSSQFASSPPLSSTMPLFHTRNDQPLHFAPWTAAPQFTMSDKETQELLNSGPNDEILYEGEEELSGLSERSEPNSNSSLPQENPSLLHENSFEKFSILGPKGNLTGTPLGTGMHLVGSSVADNSSPGAALSAMGSSPFDRLSQRPRSGFPGFYTAPGRTGSITRVRTSPIPPRPTEHDRSPSEMTLFPGPGRIVVQPPAEPLPSSSDRRKSVRIKSPTSPSRRFSRSAVNGQTKLRGLILAPGNHVKDSSQQTQISNFMSGHCARPSTSNTDTPLDPLQPVFSQVSLKPNLASEFSPHLLCPERALDPEIEQERRRTSWIIFALFCLIPPLLILYRWMGDHVINTLTKGRLAQCSAKPKRIALGAGIIVNISLICVILVPILVAQASGAV